MTRAKDFLENFTGVITEAGGQAAGKLEIAKMTWPQAEDFMLKHKFDWKKEVPKFKENFMQAQINAKKGWTVRKDMPVIDSNQVTALQKTLRTGKIDINKPFAATTTADNPFPTGLSGLAALDFLDRGLKDGSKKDDVIDVRISKLKISDLKPIQKQIYFDKSMSQVAKNGVKKSMDFITQKSFFIVSKDNFIIDGHHRFLTGMLLDPNAEINALVIDLPIKKLLPMALAYGDAIGNKRNA